MYSIWTYGLVSFFELWWCLIFSLCIAPETLQIFINEFFFLFPAEFEDDPDLYVLKPIKYVGIEVWQVCASVFLCFTFFSNWVLIAKKVICTQIFSYHWIFEAPLYFDNLNFR
jgi:hypothetical protein